MHFPSVPPFPTPSFSYYATAFCIRVNYESHQYLCVGRNGNRHRRHSVEWGRSKAKWSENTCSASHHSPAQQLFIWCRFKFQHTHVIFTVMILVFFSFFCASCLLFSVPVVSFHFSSRWFLSLIDDCSWLVSSACFRALSCLCSDKSRIIDWPDFPTHPNHFLRGVMTLVSLPLFGQWNP